MKLKLLDIDLFINKKNIQKVTSSSYYEGSGRASLNKSGLFSEEIFGRTGSRERKKYYGYVDLKLNFIHPEVYKILTNVNTDLTKYILGKQKYIISNDGQLIADDEGTTGVFDCIQKFSKINLDELKTKKPKHINYIKNNIDKIFINKYLILPAGYRDIQMSATENRIKFSEINELYVKLINQTNMLVDDLDSFDPELMESLFNSIQRNLININSWIKGRIKGKHGLIRGGILKKVTDFSAWLVISPDNELDMGHIGLPVQIVLKLYEPFFIHHVLKKDKDNLLKGIIEKYMSTDELDTNIIKNFINKVNEIPKDIDSVTINILKETIQEIVKDKVVAYKRDPVENRESWISSYIRVDNVGFSAKLNSFDLCKNGGDYDGDTISIFALLTDEAQEQAKQSMNVLHSKSAWESSLRYNDSAFSLTQDAATAIYSATIH